MSVIVQYDIKWDTIDESNIEIIVFIQDFTSRRSKWNRLDTSAFYRTVSTSVVPISPSGVSPQKRDSGPYLVRSNELNGAQRAGGHRAPTEQPSFYIALLFRE